MSGVPERRLPEVHLNILHIGQIKETSAELRAFMNASKACKEYQTHQPCSESLVSHLRHSTRLCGQRRVIPFGPQRGQENRSRVCMPFTNSGYSSRSPVRELFKRLSVLLPLMAFAHSCMSCHCAGSTVIPSQSSWSYHGGLKTTVRDIHQQLRCHPC